MTRIEHGWWVEYQLHGKTVESPVFDTEHEAQTFVSELDEDVTDVHVIPPSD